MISLNLGKANGKPLTILCLGCHSDDIEIGCGGTILRIVQEHPTCRFYWVVMSALDQRRAEAELGAELFAGRDRLQALELNAFRDGFMPHDGADIKQVFERMKKEISPDVILTHSRDDAHQDHRLVAELTWNTFRNHLILEYEIPKYDGDLGRPSVFVPLEAAISERKASLLMDVFRTQQGRAWFQESTFLAMMRIRGVECNAPSGYAEAFYCRKMVI